LELLGLVNNSELENHLLQFVMKQIRVKELPILVISEISKNWRCSERTGRFMKVSTVI
jgi:hypothetical protein